MTKKPLYVCATCSQDFTRKSNAKRHNQNIHLGKAEIVRFLEYLIGTQSGKYSPSDPLSFRSPEEITKIIVLFMNITIISIMVYPAYLGTIQILVRNIDKKQQTTEPLILLLQRQVIKPLSVQGII